MKKKLFLLSIILLVFSKQEVLAQAPSVTVQYNTNQIPFIKFDYQVTVPYKGTGRLKVYQIKTGADTLTVKNVIIKSLESGSIIRNDLFSYKIVFCITDSIGQKGYKGIVITYGSIDEVQAPEGEFIVQATYDTYGRLLDNVAAEHVPGMVYKWGYYQNHPDKFVCIKSMQINK
jgi:hypothetical protein